MKKLLVSLSAICMVAGSFTIAAADAGNTTANNKNTVTTMNKTVMAEASDIYNQINFNGNKLSFEAFSKAYEGYMNLRNAGKIVGKQILSVADFTLSSAKDRLWVIDLAAKKVLFNTFVAHGQGSGKEYANAFSNKDNTHQSSLGFYVTGDTYSGKHGTSLRLHGMDDGFNDAAFDRGIVMHGADYIGAGIAAQTHRIGRSWGCPAVASGISHSIINAIKGSTCLFIYYPDAKYMKSSQWLTRKSA